MALLDVIARHLCLLDPHIASQAGYSSQKQVKRFTSLLQVNSQIRSVGGGLLALHVPALIPLGLQTFG